MPLIEHTESEHYILGSGDLYFKGSDGTVVRFKAVGVVVRTDDSIIDVVEGDKVVESRPCNSMVYTLVFNAQRIPDRLSLKRAAQEMEKS